MDSWLAHVAMIAALFFSIQFDAEGREVIMLHDLGTHDEVY